MCLAGLVLEPQALSETHVSARVECASRVDQMIVAVCVEKFQSLCVVGVESTPN